MTDTLEIIDLDQLTADTAKCRGWASNSSGCTNEPTWRALTHCGQAALFCAPCKEHLQRKERAAANRPRKYAISCTFCGLKPKPPLTFHEV